MTRRQGRFLVMLVLVLVILSVWAHAACETALVVMDVQNYPLREWSPWLTVNEEYIVDAVARVLGLARSAGVPVIYIQEIYPFTELTLDLELTEDQAFPDEIAPAAGDAVIRKSGQDGFASGALLRHLNDEGIRRLLFCGIASNSCVQITANAAVLLGFDVTVVGDAVTTLPGKPSYAATWNTRFVERMSIPVLFSGEIDWASFGCGS